MSADFTARGLARQTSQRLASTAVGEGAALIGFRNPVAGAFGRSAADKLADWVTPADFGPVGTGDDTAAFAAALQSGKAVYVPPLTPVAGNKPQVPYMVSQLVIPNGAMLVGQFGASYIKQIAGANRDLVVLANQNVSNFAIDGLMLDGNSANNTSGCGVNLIGNTLSVANYNPQSHPDPYCYIGNLFIFNTAGDGFRVAGAATDGQAWRAGGTVIENVRTLASRGRGAYLSLVDTYISSLDCGDCGRQAVVFSPNCGSLTVRGVKGWYSGQIDKTQGECIVLAGFGNSFDQIFAQNNIPGHGIVFDNFVLSQALSLRVQGAGNVAGFGATPAYISIRDTCNSFRVEGVCTQIGGAPAGAINLIEFANTSASVSAKFDINLTSEGSYTAMLAGETQFPVLGGSVLQSIVINGQQQLGRAVAPVWPAAQNPSSGWAEYCDASMANALVLRSSTGVVVPLTPVAYTIATLPAASAAQKGARAYVTNGAAAPALGSVPSTAGTTYCPVYCDGAAWRYG